MLVGGNGLGDLLFWSKPTQILSVHLPWVGAQTVQRPPLSCHLTKLCLIPSLLAKSLHPPCSRRLCLGNPPGSRADLSQQSTFVRQTSGLQGCFFIFPSLLITLFIDGTTQQHKDPLYKLLLDFACLQEAD